MVDGPALVEVSLPSSSANGCKHGPLEFVFVEGQHKLEAVPWVLQYPFTVSSRFRLIFPVVHKPM